MSLGTGYRNELTKELVPFEPELKEGALVTFFWENITTQNHYGMEVHLIPAEAVRGVLEE